MRLPRSWLLLSALPLLLAAGLPMACSDQESRTSPGGTSGSSGGGGAGGGGGAAGAGGETPNPTPGPGELCADENPKPELVSSLPDVHVAVGKTRSFEIIVEPDVCQRIAVPLKLENGSMALLSSVGGAFPSTPNAAEATPKIDLRHTRIPIEIKGVAAGSTTLRASVTMADKTAELAVNVHVLDEKLPACSGQASGKVNPGGKIGGTAALGGAELGLPAEANKPAQATFEGTKLASPTLWVQDGFDATVGCAADILPEGFTALGPAVTFGPADRVFYREVPMAIPINPALMPDKARLRHIRVAYSGPAFKAPRVVPIADPEVVPAAEGGGWVLRFLAPRLGTYQAVLATDAGTHTFKRRLTHRALIGISMGGGGTASFGMRHHDKFDVLAPLGGPVDWTFMLDHIERNHVGGFPTNDGDTVPSAPISKPSPRNPYEHPSAFNTWWYEYPREGNGGTFARNDYTQIFRDLALMFGNPNGQNSTPGAEHLPPGVDPTHPSVRGDLPDGDCTLWVEPTGDEPNAAKLKALEQQCGASRCKYTQVLKKFYDGRYNPKGKWDVITVCDGGPQIKDKSPYANQWTTDSTSTPLEVALAVDYNGNGKRDENEPIIAQGHEPWSDVGTDGLPSAQEPGYQKGVNEDPAGDDYDPQYNPTGTENNAHYDKGEPFEDVGLDGVASTKDSPYDFGEGDNQFTASAGLNRFWDRDAHAIARQWSTPPAGAFDDKAQQRVDLWTDGGYRDLFNFAVAAQHLTGAFAARGRDAVYFSRPTKMPGQNPDDKYSFLPQHMYWDALPSTVLLRYGFIDPSETDLNTGAGQHVGSVAEITARLESALYYIDRRWPDAPRTLVDRSSNDPAPGAKQCEITGTCTFTFKDSRGREGPVSVNLPPGYAHKDQQDTRYPVVFMLHGYGQSPQDLGAAIVFLGSWMNQGLDSSATRLGKAILVYVDGRCRLGPDGSPECIRGTFYADSPREKGGKLESWFLDLMGEVDKRFRTMPESEIEWTD